jgi:hypothetical protein
MSIQFEFNATLNILKELKWFRNFHDCWLTFTALHCRNQVSPQLLVRKWVYPPGPFSAFCAHTEPVSGGVWEIISSC